MTTKLTEIPMNELTETETDHVAGGAGNQFGKEARAQDVRPWELPGFKGDAADAPGHMK